MKQPPAPPCNINTIQWAAVLTSHFQQHHHTIGRSEPVLNWSWAPFCRNPVWYSKSTYLQPSLCFITLDMLILKAQAVPYITKHDTKSSVWEQADFPTPVLFRSFTTQLLAWLQTTTRKYTVRCGVVELEWRQGACTIWKWQWEQEWDAERMKEAKQQKLQKQIKGE